MCVLFSLLLALWFVIVVWPIFLSIQFLSLKTDSNYGQKRPIIGWAHHNGQNGIELHWKDDAQPRIFGDIKQIVTAWSVVNIKISFVVQSASVSCSLSESQQHFLSDCKTAMPPAIKHTWKDSKTGLVDEAQSSPSSPLPCWCFSPPYQSTASSYSPVTLHTLHRSLSLVVCFIKSPFGWSHFGGPIKWPAYKSKGFNVVGMLYEVFLWPCADSLEFKLAGLCC